MYHFDEHRLVSKFALWPLSWIFVTLVSEEGYAQGAECFEVYFVACSKCKIQIRLLPNWQEYGSVQNWLKVCRVKSLSASCQVREPPSSYSYLRQKRLLLKPVLTNKPAWLAGTHNNYTTDRWCFSVHNLVLSSSPTHPSLMTPRDSILWYSVNLHLYHVLAKPTILNYVNY